LTELSLALRLLVAADNSLARAGLAAILGDAEGLIVVGQSALDSGLDAAIDLVLPDVVICDLGYDAPQAAERLAEIGMQGPALVALVSNPDAAAEAAPSLLGAGVRGMLLQSSPPDELAVALRAIGHGLTVFSPEIASAILPRAGANSPPNAAVETFTPREREVLVLVAEGLPNKLIARQLHISEHTVKFHVNALLTKLGATSRTEAVVRATRLGLIAL